MNFQKYTKEFAYNFQLAWPIILGMLGHTLVSFSDNVMVGQLGTTELAAVSLANSFMFVAMSLGIGFSSVLTPLMAEAHSGGDLKEGKSIVKHGLLLSLILSILLFLLIIFCVPLLAKMNQPEAVVALAIPYLEWIAISFIPLIVFEGFRNLANGLSLTKYPMYVILIGNAINVILNYALIFGAWGFPQIGFLGAAIATLISRVILLAGMIIILFYKQKSKKYLVHINFKKWSLSQIKRISNLGIPSAFQMFFEVMIFTAAIWLSGTLGENPQAANQIALNLSSITFMVIVGFNVVAMIRVGNQKGLKKFKDLRRIAHSIFLLCFIMTVLFSIVFLLFSDMLPLIYLDHNALQDNNTMEVKHLAAQLIIAAGIFQISDGIQAAVIGALRGLQDVKMPTVITFISYWLIGFPVSYYFGQADQLGSYGIWLGLIVGLSTAAILLLWRFEYVTKKLIDRNENQVINIS